MPILGINNRTENWKTAALFAPLLGERRVRLAHLLGEDWQTEPHEVRLELFWKGVRDYKHMTGTTKEELIPQCVNAYEEHFSKLYSDIDTFVEKTGKLSRLETPNYNSTDPDKLCNNLENTEIDNCPRDTQLPLYRGSQAGIKSWGRTEVLCLFISSFAST